MEASGGGSVINISLIIAVGAVRPCYHPSKAALPGGDLKSAFLSCLFPERVGNSPRVADRGLASQGLTISVESREHLQSREYLAVPVNRPQRVRHGAGRLGDDEHIPRVRLGPSRIQVSGLTHRQAGQVGNRASAVPCHGSSTRIYPKRGPATRDSWLFDQRGSILLVVDQPCPRRGENRRPGPAKSSP